MAKLFVTGASGHIGQSLVPRLCQEGHHVICLFRKDHPKLSRKYESLGASMIISDLGNSSDFGFTLKDAIIIHLAAEVKVGDLTIEEKHEMMRVNYRESRRLYENSLKFGAKHFVSIGTRQIFGNTTDPLSEDHADESISQIEEFPTVYAETKAKFYSYLKSEGTNYTILTPGIIYSSFPNQTGLPYIFSIFRNGLRFMTGDPEVSYTYIHDFVTSIINVISLPEKYIGKEFFISNGSLKRSQLFDIFQEILGTDRKIRELSQPLLRFISKIKSKFGIHSPLLNIETLNLSAMNSILNPEQSIKVLQVRYSNLGESLKNCLLKLSTRMKQKEDSQKLYVFSQNSPKIQVQ